MKKISLLVALTSAAEIAMTKSQMQAKIDKYKVENYDYLHVNRNHYKVATLNHYYKVLASLHK